MRSVILLSGGIDSAVCLAMWSGEKICLGIDYGQPHVRELDHAAAIAQHYEVPFETIKLPAMVKTNDVVFGCRNFAFIGIGAAYAAANDCDHVVVGSNASDWERFPDCRPEFTRTVAKCLEIASYPVRLATPIIRMTKTEVVNLGRKLAVPLEQTRSCYADTETPCGACLACEVRERAGA